MEFWALVARVTDRDPAVALHPDALLGAIVEAVSGQTLAEANAAGSAERLLVRKFASMLAGEDVDAPMPAGTFTAARARESAPEPAPPASSVKPASNPLPHGEQSRLVLEPEPSASAQVDPDLIHRDTHRASDDGPSIRDSPRRLRRRGRQSQPGASRWRPPSCSCSWPQSRADMVRIPPQSGRVDPCRQHNRRLEDAPHLSPFRHTPQPRRRRRPPFRKFYPVQPLRRPRPPRHCPRPPPRPSKRRCPRNQPQPSLPQRRPLHRRSLNLQLRAHSESTPTTPRPTSRRSSFPRP